MVLRLSPYRPSSVFASQSHLPPGEGFSQKYGVDSSESSPLLLTEGGTAQAVTGVEGTRCDFPRLPGKTIDPTSVTP